MMVHVHKMETLLAYPSGEPLAQRKLPICLAFSDKELQVYVFEQLEQRIDDEK